MDTRPNRRKLPYKEPLAKGLPEGMGSKLISGDTSLARVNKLIDSVAAFTHSKFRPVSK